MVKISDGQYDKQDELKTVRALQDRVDQLLIENVKLIKENEGIKKKVLSTEEFLNKQKETVLKAFKLLKPSKETIEQNRLDEYMCAAMQGILANPNYICVNGGGPSYESNFSYGEFADIAKACMEAVDNDRT